MLFQTVMFLIYTVICVSSMCDQRCQFRQYTRVKRGKFYSSPPTRFYNTPPAPMPINGPFSYTPPPFMVDYEPHYIRSKPYKVSKRPTSSYNNDLGDDDITNLVKHLSKQDLDKILEFAQGNHQDYNKYKDVYETNEYTRPYKRDSRIVHMGNLPTKFEETSSYKESKDVNYGNKATLNLFSSQETTKPIWVNSANGLTISEKNPLNNENYIPSQRGPYKIESPAHSSRVTVGSFDFNNYVTEPTYTKVYSDQDSLRPFTQTESENLPPSQPFNSQEPLNFGDSNNPYFTESNEEDKLSLPINMKEIDFEVSYTNNVPKVVTADSNSYDIKNFGDLPLMDYYNSKLHDVSSYHVPHYTVIQSKASKNRNPAGQSAPVSPYSLSSYSSSSLLKLSPAAAAIEEPVYERAPPISAAAEQSDAHLKAIKVWAHKSKGAAYTLNDDGTLTPERSRPKYG